MTQSELLSIHNLKVRNNNLRDQNYQLKAEKQTMLADLRKMESLIKNMIMEIDYNEPERN